MRMNKAEVANDWLPLPVSRQVGYYTARAVEELDLAEAASGDDARLAHEQLAQCYLRAALRLRNGDVMHAVPGAARA